MNRSNCVPVRGARRTTPFGWLRLLELVEEAEHALLDQRRGAFVVGGQAVVGEQVAVTWVQEKLRALHRVDEIAGDVEVAPLVGVHGVDLQRKAPGPPASELG